MAKRFAMPANKLRFMKDQEFEDEAALLLAEYGNKRGNRIDEDSTTEVQEVCK
jgi:hypothetical protein